MAPTTHQTVTDFLPILDNPPDIIPKREELFHLRNGAIQMSPEEYERYWPYMTNAWHKHSTHAKAATSDRPVETRIFWCRNGRADGRSGATKSRGLRRRAVENRPQCPVKMSVTVTFGVAPDGTIGMPILYELAKKSGGEHKETLRSIDGKRRNEKVIKACTQHLLDNESLPTHFVAKQWKDNETFRLALEDAGGHEVGPDDAQNYVRAEHLSRMKQTKPKKDAVTRPAPSTGQTVIAGARLLNTEILTAIKAYQIALPQFVKVRFAADDVVARRNMIGLSLQYFSSIIPALHTDPTTGVPTASHPLVRDYFTVSSHDGTYIPLRWHAPSPPIQQHGPTSAILYVVGGAMIAPSAAQYTPIISNLVKRTNVPAMAVQYRYAPEFPAPIGLQDVYDGLVYLHSHSQELGIDPSRILVIGDGGGGTVAAGLCHYSLQRGGPSIAKQVLLSPMLSDRDKPSDVTKLPPGVQLWNTADEDCAWRAVLGAKKGADNEMPGADGVVQPANGFPSVWQAPGPDVVPSRANDVPRGLPSMYIDVAEHDIVREECVEYATKFWKAGINAELHVWPGAGAWFDFIAPNARVSIRATNARVDAIVGV